MELALVTMRELFQAGRVALHDRIRFIVEVQGRHVHHEVTQDWFTTSANSPYAAHMAGVLLAPFPTRPSKYASIVSMGSMLMTPSDGLLEVMTRPPQSTRT